MKRGTIKNQLHLFFNLSLPTQMRDEKKEIKQFPKDSLVASFKSHYINVITIHCYNIYTT